jgi:hypothetical protein
VEDERLAARIAVETNNLTDDDHVVPSSVHAAKATIEPAGHAVKNWRAGRLRAMRHPAERSTPAGTGGRGKPARQWLLIGAQHANRKHAVARDRPRCRRRRT